MSIESQKNTDSPEIRDLNSGGEKRSKIESFKNAGLSGYLTRWPSQKLLKKPKQYWFVYAENSCKLYFFNSDRCSHPSGVIDISGATFSLQVDNPTACGLFRIW